MNAITIQNLQKSYVPGIPVLVDFDFELAEGEVHALVGSNGAGKSTLAKILTGLTSANSGIINFHGRDSSGIVMVLQELNIIPTLTVAENLFLKKLPVKRGMIDYSTLNRKAIHALKRVGLDSLDPQTTAGKLGVGQQQLIEIASALEKDSSVLILDEPTAALTGPEIELLFSNIEKLKTNGTSILYISHRMDEISRICDRVTVMRDGVRIATHQVSDVETSQLVSEMAGREVSTRGAATDTSSQDRPIAISVSNLSSGDKVKDVTFQAYQGEILGIAGLIGSGRTETLKAIFGAEPINAGNLTIGHADEPFLPKHPGDSIKRGIALVPEDRKNEGLLLTLDITENTVITSRNTFWADHDSDHQRTLDAGRKVDLKCDSTAQAVCDLSGGNQQKVVISRWLLSESEIYLFDEPTRGIDVAAKESIYALLDELAKQGKTVIAVSSDLTELLLISHRIIVMSDGRITGEFTPANWSKEAITAAAFSGYNDVA